MSLSLIDRVAGADFEQINERGEYSGVVAISKGELRTAL